MARKATRKNKVFEDKLSELCITRSRDNFHMWKPILTDNWTSIRQS